MTHDYEEAGCGDGSGSGETGGSAAGDAAAAALQSAIEITRVTVAGARLGPPMHHHNLTAFALYLDSGAVPSYNLLRDAVLRGDAVVNEVGEHGRVGELEIVNRGARPLLVPEGEILAGGKQNRMVNITVLVAPASSRSLPVSCVERGRWAAHPGRVAPVSHAPPSLRAATVDSVNMSRSLGRGPRSDQSRVWMDVDRVSQSTGLQSPTASLFDVLEGTDAARTPFREAISLPAGASGFVAGAGGKVIGVELVGSPALMATLWDSLTAAYFSQASWDPEPRRPTTAAEARAFLDLVAAGLSPSVGAAGLGASIVVDGPGVVGSALVFEGALCHLAAFQRQGEDQGASNDE